MVGGWSEVEVLWVGALFLERGRKRERYSFRLPPPACSSIQEFLCLIINTLEKNYPLWDRDEVS